ncbi:uncharacterized protein BO80DRAFT_11290 [Aspergillus ibericus CBS 121593]|uniref:Uncharacterized protein n=1 Tax=Aspergillus ibericus CBS 121593 TaxID=1448316 RepID=A0A395HFX3_9EURO|nr:hypothetical protein BO80DRAFT_11290 [Aspergillus ibericus CBS 121593]RAL06399.1 hypothetical protein BO80DRAFT_11290 [Aspergillus ibericus CBS 121593]
MAVPDFQLHQTGRHDLSPSCRPRLGLDAQFNVPVGVHDDGNLLPIDTGARFCVSVCPVDRRAPRPGASSLSIITPLYRSAPRGWTSPRSVSHGSAWSNGLDSLIRASSGHWTAWQVRASVGLQLNVPSPSLRPTNPKSEVEPSLLPINRLRRREVYDTGARNVPTI